MDARSSADGSVYPPDRTAVLLFVAVHAGLALIWSLAYLRPGMAGRTLAWAFANAAPLSYYALDRLFGLWLCGGVLLGRRWAFVGMVLFGAHVAVESVYFEPDAYALVGVSAAAYSVARLLFLGPRPPRPEVPPAFLPDKVVGVAFAVLNVLSTVAFLVRPLPTRPVTPMLAVHLLVTLALCLWFNAGIYRSRGWSVGTGLFFCVIGVLALNSSPEQRAQMAGAVFGIFYFSARLCGLGPRPEGLLGVRST